MFTPVCSKSLLNLTASGEANSDCHLVHFLLLAQQIFSSLYLCSNYFNFFKLMEIVDCKNELSAYIS